MKSLCVLAVVLMVVTAVAVSGSRAQPVPATSVAFQQCQGGGRMVTEQCRPVIQVRSLMAEQDFEFGAFDGANEANEMGGDRSTPDWHWKDLFVEVLYVFGKWMASHFGGPQAGAPALDQIVFDPPQ